MITLTKKLKQDTERGSSGKKRGLEANGLSRASIRDKLLVKEVQEMEQHLPAGCRVKFEDPNALHDFVLAVCPEEGFWQGGKFKFHIKVPLDYNMAPPEVKCLTRLWHPNISEQGDICLSILRQNSVDGMGWAPTRRLRDVVWGLNSLFDDLLNFDDPLNIEAADHFMTDRESFRTKVRDWIGKYAKR